MLWSSRHHKILENAKRSGIEEHLLNGCSCSSEFFSRGFNASRGKLSESITSLFEHLSWGWFRGSNQAFSFFCSSRLLINPRHKKPIKFRKQVKPEQTDYFSMSSGLERRRKRKRRRHETWKRIWLDEHKRAIRARSRGSLCKQGSRNATVSCLMLQARDVLPIPFCHSVTWWSPLEKIKQTTLKRSSKKKKLESPEKTSSSGLSTEYYLWDDYVEFLIK